MCVLSLTAATRSTTFDKKLRLIVAFFNRGHTMACFRVSGKTASLNEALHIIASVGASSDSSRFSSHVGTGSSEQYLAGAC